VEGINIFVNLLKSNDFDSYYINTLAEVFKTELEMVKLLVTFDIVQII
jgi:hypothetical protein